MRRKFKLMVMTIMFFIIVSIMLPCSINQNTYARSEMDICETDYIPDAKVEMGVYVPDAEVEIVKKVKTTTKKIPTRQKPKIKKKEELPISKDEVNLLALLCMAEAEGECEKGKRLVIDTVLNRVDSKQFPNTIREVIYQKNQFTSTFNGRMDRCYVKKDICKLVEEEVRSRLNSEVLFFTAGRYGDYGTPMFRVENHYFSK